jgi:4-hydroxy-3-methylbut-2-enyl diphosphate reductase
LHIEIAKNGGFCFGVRRAVESVVRCLEEDSRVYTLGPIIHNPQVVAMLEGRGVRMANSVAEVDGGTVVIRSHGAPPGVYEECRLRGIRLVDATCPRVKRIQEKVYSCRQKGQPVILIGERDHPEVLGVNGWCGGEAFVVNSLEDVRALPPMDSACVAAQTTLPQARWDELMPAIREVVPNCEEFPSICQATRERQRDAAELARRSDCMIVIGGKNSTNTRRLYELCRRYCPATWQIETAEQLNWDRICRYERIGIASGASTPDWIIKEVYRTMSDMAHNELPLEEVREDSPGETRRGSNPIRKRSSNPPRWKPG